MHSVLSQSICNGQSQKLTREARQKIRELCNDKRGKDVLQKQIIATEKKTDAVPSLVFIGTHQKTIFCQRSRQIAAVNSLE